MGQKKASFTYFLAANGAAFIWGFLTTSLSFYTISGISHSAKSRYKLNLFKLRRV
jgi:hypothetical protein